MLDVNIRVGVCLCLIASHRIWKLLPGHHRCTACSSACAGLLTFLWLNPKYYQMYCAYWRGNTGKSYILCCAKFVCYLVYFEGQKLGQNPSLHVYSIASSPVYNAISIPHQYQLLDQRQPNHLQTLINQRWETSTQLCWRVCTIGGTTSSSTWE